MPRGPREITAQPRISRGVRRYVAVCGASEATPTQLDAAREVGRLLAKHGAVVINGGFGGVMGAASEGAASEGGTGGGILPDTGRGGAEPHLTIALPTGLGQGRNTVFVPTAGKGDPVRARWGTPRGMSNGPGPWGS